MVFGKFLAEGKLSTWFFPKLTSLSNSKVHLKLHKNTTKYVVWWPGHNHAVALCSGHTFIRFWFKFVSLAESNFVRDAFSFSLEDIIPFRGSTDAHVFWLLVTSALGFKARVDPFLHAFLPVWFSHSFKFLELFQLVPRSVGDVAQQTLVWNADLDSPGTVTTTSALVSTIFVMLYL